MTMIKKLWEALKATLTVAAPQLMAKEPAIVAGVTALAVSVATHYGLHLSAIQQTYVSGGALFLLNFIVRQVVTPSTTTAINARSGDVVKAEPETYHLSAQRKAPAKKTAKKAPAKKTASASRVRRK